MGFMITIGILTRTLHVLPEAFIAVFLYRIVSSPNYNRYPIYMVLVEKQASTSLISHSVYRGFHDGCCFPLAQCQREPPQKKRQHHQSLFQIVYLKKCIGYTGWYH